jgi:Protein of unknown function with PCYCGC motif
MKLFHLKRPAVLGVVALAAVFAFAQGDHVPAYNTHSLQPGEAAPILPKDMLWGEAFKFPFQVHAYELAAKIPNVINQLPCYCYCERVGHKSLHTCFESEHGAHCGICMKEVYYAYQQDKLGKSPEQIRKGIIAGDWKAVDLEKASTIN